MYKTLAIFISIILLTALCKAQSRVEVTGKVVDSFNGLPLLDAKVRLCLERDTLLLYTDSNGNFSFYASSSKTFDIIVSYVGYKDYSQTMEVPLSKQFEIGLEFNSELLTESLVVARSKALLGIAEQGKISINTDKLGQIPSVMGVPDVIKTLQLMPGVQNSGEANGYLYVRGADPGHNLMLYDDAPVYGMSHLLGIFPFYNTDHIDRIHFDKSNTNAKYGNRLSSTLQTISSNKLPDEFSLKGNIGLVASQLTADIPLGKKAGVIVSGRQTYIDQILTPLLNSSTVNDKNKVDDLAYSFSDANLTFMVKPNGQHDISLNAFFSGDRFRIKEKEMLLDGKMKWSNNTASVAWTWRPNPELNFKQSLYFSHYGNNLQVGQASIDLKVESKVIDWGASSSVQFDLLNIPVEAGVQFSKYDVHPQEIVSTQLAWGNIATTDNTVKAWQASLYVQMRPQLTPFLYFDLGLRASRYATIGVNSRRFFHVEPKVSLNYTPNARFSAYISYARKNQYLNLLTTSSVGFPTDFWVAATDGIPSQSANSFSIGSMYKLTSGFEVNAGLFYSQLNNLIEYPFSILQFNEISGFGEDIYIGEGKAYGAELLLKKTGRLSGWISYTLSKADRKFSDVNDNHSYPAKFDRRHNLSVVAHYQLSKRWSAGLTQLYSTGSRFTTPTSWYFINNNPVKEYGTLNNAKMPDYIRTDISVDFLLNKSSKRESILNFSVYNLFAVINPIYVILDISASDSGNEINVRSRYKNLYTILPSISWRFKF